jgi:hypothetical protein
MKGLFATGLIAGGLFLPAAGAAAQEVVHVVAATVRHVNPQNGMIITTTDDGSEGMFKGADAKVQTNLDKALIAQITPAQKFVASSESTAGDRVIVFYFEGVNSARSAYAVLDLGKGPFDKSTGTVTKFDRHGHMLTIKDDSGIETTFRIAATTVGDMTDGAVQGFKYDVGKGERVRVTATAANGGEDALLIVPAN